MTDDDPYQDPLYYDLEYADHVEDIAWYVELGRRSGGPVLELGCGTGRITLALARAGVPVTGLDRHPAMLAGLERRLLAEPDAVRMRVRLQAGDFRALDPTGRHPLVILPFNAVHHCADHRDVLGLLASVRGALRPGGRFALDCYLPDLALYERNPLERYGERTFVHPVTAEPIESWEQSAYDPLAQVHHITYVYVRADGTEHRVRLRLRMFWPQELRGLIDLGGFDVLSEASDFAGAPLVRDAHKWVMVLAPRP